MIRHKRGRKICAIIKKKKKLANRNRPAHKILEITDKKFKMTMINVLRKIDI